MKYYHNLKQRLSTLMYFKMQFIHVRAKLNLDKIFDKKKNLILKKLETQTLISSACVYLVFQVRFVLVLLQ